MDVRFKRGYLRKARDLEEENTSDLWKLTSEKEITVFLLGVCQSSLSPFLKVLQRKSSLHPLITHLMYPDINC